MRIRDSDALELFIAFERIEVIHGARRHIWHEQLLRRERQRC